MQEVKNATREEEFSSISIFSNQFQFAVTGHGEKSFDCAVIKPAFVIEVEICNELCHKIYYN